MDRMISLVEGAQRQKTPNEIALIILLSALTIIFLVVILTLKCFGLYSGISFSITVLVALLVCLIPTTIGGLLSAIGIAGIDRLVQKNVLAMSGRAVEAAGDIDVLLLDKTGTITLGNRQATEFIPAPGLTPEELADAAQLASLADETPEGRSIVVLAKQYGLRGRAISEMPHAAFINFTAHTRMSGVDIDGRQIRKGAPDAVKNFIGQDFPRPVAEAVEIISRSQSSRLKVWSAPKMTCFSTRRPGFVAATSSRSAWLRGTLKSFCPWTIRRGHSDFPSESAGTNFSNSSRNVLLTGLPL